MKVRRRGVEVDVIGKNKEELFHWFGYRKQMENEKMVKSCMEMM